MCRLRRHLLLGVVFVLVEAGSWLGAIQLWAAENSHAASAKPRIVTSILPVYCLTHAVAGRQAGLDNLLAAGADAHDFQLTRRERQLIDSADLLILNGLGMEQWLEKALRNVRPGLTILEAAAGLGRVPGTARSERNSQPNPHVWLDPVLACGMVTNILRALQVADPARASTYASNAAVCVSELLKLDAEFRKRLAPFRNTPIVTHHDAFDHFARRYELRVVAVIEEVPDVEPTFSHLGAVAKAVRENGVKVIFTEPHHSGRLAQRLAADLNVRVVQLDTLESGPLRPTAYEEAMLANLGVLEQSLK